MTPQDLGFPPFFTDFRPAQEEAISHVLCSSSKYVGIGAPPGVGKSGIAMALAKLLPGRTTILTATLGLQDQYEKIFGASMGLSDMRGRSHYSCWEGGTCEDGGKLGCGDREGCPYLGAFNAWKAAPINETSYAFWLAHPLAPKAIPDTLILDEAGVAGEWLSRSLDVSLTQEECQRAGMKLGTPREQLDLWLKLAPALADRASEYYDEVKHALYSERNPGKHEKLRRELKHADGLLERVAKLRLLNNHNWVIEQVDDRDRRTWKFECVWPGAYNYSLFRGVDRVVLLSATLRPKTLRLLGLSRDVYDFREWTRQFPAVNGPVLHVPTVRMNARATPEDERVWLETIDRIIDQYPHQKGLVHTVSYARARLIVSGSRHRNRFVWNDNADPKSPRAAQIFDLFEKLDPREGNVLVSPSFSTGWDFAGDRAEYQIIAKVPIPDTRSRVMQARCEKDKDYPMYLAAQELVQGCGRINRSAEERGTTYIVDDSIKWFMHLAKDHMPRWFKVRSLDKGEMLPTVWRRAS